MFNSRYSEPEMQQWHDACSSSTNSTSDATRQEDAVRQEDARISMAKGQAARQQSRTASAAMQTHTLRHDWASECLFDWYNS